MTKRAQRWTLASVLILVLLAAGGPRIHGFVGRSLDLADRMAEIRRHPAPVYPRPGGFYHFGQVPAPGRLAADADALLASVVSDGSGISLAAYPPPLGKRFNPVFAASAALTGVAYRDDPRMPGFIRAHLDALVARAETTAAGNLVFPYRYDWPPAGQKAPWHSAMAQGQAASALLWGHRLFGRDDYLDAARRAILALAEDRPRPFFKALPGGDAVWLKEYPGYRFNVLDGALFAIAGVHDLWRSLPGDHPDRPAVGRLRERAMAGLKQALGCFGHPVWGHAASDFGAFLGIHYYQANLAMLDYLSAHEPVLSRHARSFMLPDRARTADVVLAMAYRAWEFLKNRGPFDVRPCF